MLKIGDEVDVLDEAISGKIVGLNGTSATIKTSDGFELDFYVNELILRQLDGLVESNLFTKTSLSEAVSQKETKKKDIC